MKMNFADLVTEGLDNRSLVLNALKQEKTESTIGYIHFTNLLLEQYNLDDMPQETIQLKDLMKDNFLENYAKAFELAVENKRSDDPVVNKRINAIRSVVNNGYLNKDIHTAKMELPNTNILNENFF